MKTGNEHFDKKLEELTHHYDEGLDRYAIEGLIGLVSEVAALAVETRDLQVGGGVVPKELSIRSLFERLEKLVELGTKAGLWSEPLDGINAVVNRHYPPRKISVGANAARESAHDLVTFETDPAPHLSKEMQARLEGVIPLPLSEAALRFRKLNEGSKALSFSVSSSNTITYPGLAEEWLRLIKSAFLLQSQLAAVVTATEDEGEQLSVFGGSLQAIVDHLQEGVEKCRYVNSPKIDNKPGTQKIIGVTVEPIQWERINQALGFARNALKGKAFVGYGATETIRLIRDMLKNEEMNQEQKLRRARELCDNALKPKISIEQDSVR